MRRYDVGTEINNHKKKGGGGGGLFLCCVVVALDFGGLEGGEKRLLAFASELEVGVPGCAPACAGMHFAYSRLSRRPAGIVGRRCASGRERGLFRLLNRLSLPFLAYLVALRGSLDTKGLLCMKK